MQFEEQHINSQSENSDYQRVYDSVLTVYSKGIDKISSHINSIISISERDFLEIGSKLQRFSNNSRELSRLSLEAFSFISEDILKNGIVELSWLLKEFSRRLSGLSKEIKEDKEQLESIQLSIDQISDEFSGFRKLVKQLKMLGISTKIESSRLGSEDAGFYQLAEYVEKLSGFIEEKVKALLLKTDKLINELIRTISYLNQLEKEHRQKSINIVQNTSKSLVNFNDRYELCSSNIKNISESTDQLSKNINSIVTSIQFHDITRQQIEHTRDALFALENSYGIYSPENPAGCEDNLAIIHDTCELQTCQLEHSSEEFTSAALRIIHNLKGVENSIAIISNDTFALLDSGSNSDNFSLIVVKDEFKKISNGLITIATELSQSTMSVLGIIEDLAKSIHEIEDIGNEIELIALNARIKAAHIGNNGASLGVLSESIQKLSACTKNQTEAVSALLKTTSEISSKLKVNLESVESAENKNAIEMTDDKIQNLMTTMIEMENKTSGLFEILKRDINGLQKEISSTIDKFTIHNSVEESLSSAISELRKITELIKPHVAQNKPRENNIENLEEKYTMHQERKIHQKYIQSSISEKDDYGKRCDEGEFGSNVELF